MIRPSLDFQDRMGRWLNERETQLRALLETGPQQLRHEHDRTEVIDSKDAAEEESLAAVDEVLAARAASELDAVVAARRRMAAGTYGTCLSCGQAIGEERLLAQPAAPLCLQCQTDLE